VAPPEVWRSYRTVRVPRCFDTAVPRSFDTGWRVSPSRHHCYSTVSNYCGTRTEHGCLRMRVADFASRIAAIESLKSHHRAALAELDTLFASLQHRAFRGEL